MSEKRPAVMPQAVTEIGQLTTELQQARQEIAARDARIAELEGLMCGIRALTEMVSDGDMDIPYAFSRITERVAVQVKDEHLDAALGEMEDEG